MWITVIWNSVYRLYCNGESLEYLLSDHLLIIYPCIFFLCWKSQGKIEGLQADSVVFYEYVSLLITRDLMIYDLPVQP